jgi:hypothetical protein
VPKKLEACALKIWITLRLFCISSKEVELLNAIVQIPARFGLMGAQRQGPPYNCLVIKSHYEYEKVLAFKLFIGKCGSQEIVLLSFTGANV